jgi:tetratricopeptide (TPR) repeat protein
MMKIFNLVTYFLVVHLSLVQAQRNAVLSAWEYLEAYTRERQTSESLAIDALMNAKKEIEGAIEHPVTSVESKTWKRRGDVYYLIATDASPRLILEKEGAIEKAAESFLKAMTVEIKSNGKPQIEEKSDILVKLVDIANRIMKNSVEFLEANDFESAMKGFELSKKIYEECYVNDPKNSSLSAASGNALQYMTMTAIYKKDYDLAEKLCQQVMQTPDAPAWVYSTLASIYLDNKKFDKAADLINKRLEKHPSDTNIFLANLRLALETEDAAKATELLKEGKARFPQKRGVFVIEEVNFYLVKEDDEKAIAALEEAVSTFSDEPELLKQLCFNAGVIYDKLSEKKQAAGKVDGAIADREKALGYYKKVIDIDPNFHSAYNQIANYYVTIGNELVIRANNLPLEKNQEHNKLKAESIEQYKIAAKFLETGYDLTKDETIKTNLIEIYKKTQELDKLQKLMGGN